jgi:hypothetical protein
LYGRNLDFTNLDHLEIDGEYNVSRETRIFYSTLEKLKLKNVDALFTEFFGCEFEKLEAHNTKWYWLEFYGCTLYGANFENSTLRNVIFENSILSGFSFNRTEAENVQYKPNLRDRADGKTGSFASIKDNYKRFRTLFQNNGLRKEASEAFYNEKCFELKHNWLRLELSKTLTHLFRKNIAYTTAHFKHHLSIAIETFVDLSSFLIWGFGERPSRVLLCSGTIMTIFTFIYYFSGIQTLAGDLTNSAYLSIIMFSTLGFGDFAPVQDGQFKLVLALEALTGAFFWGMFISGYANKSRY